MILTGKEIEKQVKKNRIHLSPFKSENINPNSYNFCLGDKIEIYQEETLDPAKENSFKQITIPKDGFVLKPNQLYLGHTKEEMGSDYYVPTIQARSSVGRLGLFIYLNSGLGDIGFKKQWTLELYTVQKLKIYPKMKIGQILFWQPKGKIFLYRGKYRNSVGPQPSQIYKDFEN